MNEAWLRPDWPLAGVGAFMTTRQGGVSEGPWSAMNLGAACGDDPAHVVANRQLLEASTVSSRPVRPVFLTQVHGVRVIELHAGERVPEGSDALQADASFTTEPGVACAVLAADCLPLLFAARGANGAVNAVAAAHAGWRGLAAGVVEATLARVCEAASCGPADVSVWLGACIGPKHFLVGADVLEAFGAAVDERSASAAARDNRFVPEAPGKWLADLPGLAHDRLRAAGVVGIHGGSWCTVADAARFFSYRRDRITGRMAACIFIDR